MAGSFQSVQGRENRFAGAAYDLGDGSRGRAAKAGTVVPAAPQVAQDTEVERGQAGVIQPCRDEGRVMHG
jgi:hypothetical protein